jgi:peroxiredoxin
MRNTLTASTLVLLASCAQPPAVPPHAAPDMARHPPAASGMPAAAPAPQFALTPTPAAALGTAPAGLGLAVGQEAPDATLTDITGRSHGLKALYGSGPTLVIFYRGGWCPFCNLQLHEFSEAKGEFERRGVQIAAISVDQPSAEAKTQARHGVPFLMLSDSRLDAHRAFRVVHVPGDEERSKLAGYGIDLAAYSGQMHGSFAVPALFLIDRGGAVRFAHVDDDYKTRPSAAQMLAVVDRVFLAK